MAKINNPEADLGGTRSITYTDVILFKKELELETKRRALNWIKQHGIYKALWYKLFRDEPSIRYDYMPRITRLAKLSLETIAWLESSSISIDAAYTKAAGVNEVVLRQRLQKTLNLVAQRRKESPDEATQKQAKIIEAIRDKSERTRQARVTAPLFGKKMMHLAAEIRRTIRNLQGNRTDQAYDGLENMGLPGLSEKNLDDLIAELGKALPIFQRLHKKALVEKIQRNKENIS